MSLKRLVALGLPLVVLVASASAQRLGDDSPLQRSNPVTFLRNNGDSSSSWSNQHHHHANHDDPTRGAGMRRGRALLEAASNPSKEERALMKKGMMMGGMMGTMGGSGKGMMMGMEKGVMFDGKCKSGGFKESDLRGKKKMMMAKKPNVAKTCNKVETKTTDVVVVGAGAAGVRAAARVHEVAPDLEVTVLESTDSIGGRVKPFSTEGGLVLQAGANWLNYPGDDAVSQVYTEFFGPKYVETHALNNVTVYEITCPHDNNRRTLRDGRRLELMDRLLQRLEQDTTLEKNAKALALRRVHILRHRLAQEACSAEKVPADELDAVVAKWANEIVPCMDQLGDDFYCEVFDPEEDIGKVAFFLQCGYDDTDPLEELMDIIYQDYEFAGSDGSIFAWSNPYDVNALFVLEDWAASIKSYAASRGIDPVFDARVTKIEYDLKNGPIKARVTSQDSDGNCVVYDAQRVISTVSVGVLNEGLIEFEPALKYPEATTNPLQMYNYVKIFFKFNEKFWDTVSDYIHTIYPDDFTSANVIWQDVDKIFPGENILMLTLLEEGFAEVVGEDNVQEEEIPNDIIYSMLQPLREVFPDTYVEPCDFFYNKFHADINTGYGAFSEWEIGYTPYDYYNFFGSYDFGEYIDPCDHNGCNDDNEWIMYISGTAVCLEDYEFVNGGWLSGEFASNLMLESLGYDLGAWDHPCYIQSSPAAPVSPVAAPAQSPSL